MATLADVAEDATDAARAQVRSLILTGDNRLKQGGPVQARKARETYEKALAEAEAAGVDDDLIRGLLERRIEDSRALEQTAGDA
jgi:chorismate mutase